MDSSCFSQVMLCWFVLCYTGLLAWDHLYTYRWFTLAGAITFGLIFSFAIVVPYAAVKNHFLLISFLEDWRTRNFGAGGLMRKCG